MSYSQNSLKGGYMGFRVSGLNSLKGLYGDYYRGIKGDTGS